MKNLILIVISGLFLIGCGETERERIDQDKLDAMVAKQRSEAERSGTEPMDVNFSRKSVSSSTGGFDMDQNSIGDLIVAGDKGVFLNGNQLSEPDVSSKGSEIAVSINDNGDFIVAGNKSIFVKKASEDNADIIRDFKVGSDDSFFSTYINENGDWIAVGDRGILINGKRVRSRDIPRNATRFEAVIDEDLNWKIYTNDGTISGSVLVNDDEQSLTDES